MRKMLIAAMLLLMSVQASAEMTLSSDAYNIEENGLARITLFSANESQRGGYYIGLDLSSSGNGFFSIDNAQIDYAGSITNIYLEYDSGISSFLNVQDPHIALELNDQSSPVHPLEGTLVHNIIFQATDAGNIKINLFDGGGSFLDDVNITIVPEPITIGLLGLGAMFLRRRK